MKSLEPCDLAGWKAADSRLTKRFVDQMQEAGFWSATALRGYFGDEDAKALLIAHQALAVAQAFTTWAILEYRPTRTGETLRREDAGERTAGTGGGSSPG